MMKIVITVKHPVHYFMHDIKMVSSVFHVDGSDYYGVSSNSRVVDFKYGGVRFEIPLENVAGIANK